MTDHDDLDAVLDAIDAAVGEHTARHLQAALYGAAEALDGAEWDGLTSGKAMRWVPPEQRAPHPVVEDSPGRHGVQFLLTFDLSGPCSVTVLSSNAVAFTPDMDYAPDSERGWSGWTDVGWVDQDAMMRAFRVPVSISADLLWSGPVSISTDLVPGTVAGWAEHLIAYNWHVEPPPAALAAGHLDRRCSTGWRHVAAATEPAVAPAPPFPPLDLTRHRARCYGPPTSPGERPGPRVRGAQP